MAEPWVPLLGASILIAIGFLAAQVFERFRLPDYVILIAVGIALGSGVLPLGAWSPAPLPLAGAWPAGVAILGLTPTTPLTPALAMCAPSAAIVLSVPPRIRVTDRTR